jgi:hypothetical protein
LSDQFAEAEVRQMARPATQDEVETTRIEMKNGNINIQFPRGVDASQGGVTVPVITTPAEKSALNANVESNPQKTEMQENLGGDLRQSDSAEPGKYRATTGPVLVQEEGGTPRTEMLHKNIHSSQGVDALHSSMTASVVDQAGEATIQPQAKRNTREKVGLDDPRGQGVWMKIQESLISEKHTEKPFFYKEDETDAENMAFHLSPESDVDVGDWIINHTTGRWSIIPSLHGQLKDMTEELRAHGYLRDGDQIETISFEYDLTNLKVLRVRLQSPYDRDGWIEPPPGQKDIAALEKYLADNLAGSWRAMNLEQSIFDYLKKAA